MHGDRRVIHQVGRRHLDREFQQLVLRHRPGAGQAGIHHGRGCGVDGHCLAIAVVAIPPQGAVHERFRVVRIVCVGRAIQAIQLEAAAGIAPAVVEAEAVRPDGAVAGVAVGVIGVAAEGCPRLGQEQVAIRDAARGQRGGDAGIACEVGGDANL